MMCAMGRGMAVDEMNSSGITAVFRIPGEAAFLGLKSNFLTFRDPVLCAP
jgi:hypothetical protein